MLNYLSLFFKFETLFKSGLFAWILGTVAWIFSIFLKDVSLIDVVWALLYTCQAVIYFLNSSYKDFHRFLFSLIVSLHGLRLAFHLFKRRIDNSFIEDKRYTKIFRNRIGSQFWWISYFVVFIPQIILSLFLGMVFFEFNLNNNNASITGSFFSTYTTNIINQYINLDKVTHNVIDTASEVVNRSVNDLFGGFYIWIISKIIGIDLSEKESFIKKTVTNVVNNIKDNIDKTIPIPNYNNLIFTIGIFTMIAGFVIESIADWQLAAHVKTKKKELINRGLWYYSRHPNMFGESLFWFGTFFCNMSAGIFYTLYSPILITFLLLKVTGVNIIEEEMEKIYGNDFKEYKRTTSMFIPWVKSTKTKTN